eukprot:514793-Alexandrium_andersonii.AAC.1
MKLQCETWLCATRFCNAIGAWTTDMGTEFGLPRLPPKDLKTFFPWASATMEVEAAEANGNPRVAPEDPVLA